MTRKRIPPASAGDETLGGPTARSSAGSGAAPHGPLPVLSETIAAAYGAQCAAIDEWRVLQARALNIVTGLGAGQCAFRVVATGSHWRLRRYAGQAVGPSVLMVPAPIKRPGIWDLTPRVSAVRFCLARALGVHLIEWLPPAFGDGSAGLDAYAAAIATAADVVAAQHDGVRPVLLGHSLGGTLAAIATALRPDLARGLVVLGAPLCFAPGSSPFRDVVVAQAPRAPGDGTVAGSQLSQACALLAPGAFVWSRWIDRLQSLSDPVAFEIHVRVERWALDEMALPGRLLRQVIEQLYRDDDFVRGVLAVGGRMLGPDNLRVPVLAAVNDADEVGPAASVVPFFAAMSSGETALLAHPAEIGVGFQHLAILAGRRAHAEVWPKIVQWIAARG